MAAFSPAAPYHHPRRWLAILAAPRSGTTFLMEALSAADSCLAVSGEAVPAALPAVLNANLDDTVRSALVSSVGAQLDAYAMLQETSRAAALADALRRNVGPVELLEGLRRRRICEAILYKEPFFSFAPEALAAALPGCRAVHLVRDGRDVADSFVRRYDMLSDDRLRPGSNEVALGRPWDERWIPWWVEDGQEDRFLAGSSFVRAAWMWAAMSRNLRRFAEADTAGAVLTIRYEELVARPVEVGGAVLDHLGLRANRRVERRLRAGTVGSVGIHRQRDPAELAEAEAIIGEELQQHGYLARDPSGGARQCA